MIFANIGLATWCIAPSNLALLPVGFRYSPLSDRLDLFNGTPNEGMLPIITDTLETITGYANPAPELYANGEQVFIPDGITAEDLDWVTVEAIDPLEGTATDQQVIQSAVVRGLITMITTASQQVQSLSAKTATVTSKKVVAKKK